MVNDTFPDAFIHTARRFPERPALELNGLQLTYRELERSAKALAFILQRASPRGPVALLARHSADAYVGLLGIHLSGHAYLPLSPEYPPSRNVEILRQAGSSCVLAEDVAKAVAAIGSSLPELVVLPLQREESDLQLASGWLPPPAMNDELAYVIFTSGTSGTPKGTRITHGNVAAAMSAICGRIRPRATDRISQTFELTFDGSLFTIFLAWTSGACLVPQTPGAILQFHSAIRQRRLTVWTATPSSVALMQRLRVLQPNSFPELRYSVFAGEPIDISFLAMWARAAPGSVIDNIYGPTEATIACTAYRWERHSPPSDGAEIAPIGSFIGDTRGRIVDDALCEVAEGEVGELLLAGPQVSPGYLDDEITRSRFVRPFEPGTTYYRTGDLVKRQNGQLRYIGRVDHQVKIRGYRVELAEVESHLRRLLPSSFRTAAIAWPKSSACADGIVAFVEGDAMPVAVLDLQQALASSLPKPMVPRKILALPQMPMTAHGKIDRTALERFVAKEDAKANGIVVLGVPRSGTTLIARLLDAHPGIACPGETYFLRACARFIESDTMPNGIGLGVLQGLHRLQHEPGAVIETLRNWAIDVLASYAISQGKTHWAEKTAANVFYLEEIERLFGGHTRFVVVLRHGLDVAASLVELSEKVGGYYRELHDWVARYRSPAEAFVRMWTERTALLLDFVERQGPNARVVKYEDLVEDPDCTLNDVFRFIGVAEQSSLVERALAKPGAFGIGDWKANQYASVRKDSVDRWKRLMAPQIPTLAGIANPILQRAGYGRVEYLDDYVKIHDERLAAATQLANLVPRGRIDDD